MNPLNRDLFIDSWQFVCRERPRSANQDRQLQIAIGNPQSKISFQIESGNQENRNLRDFISLSNIGVSACVHCLQSAIENLTSGFFLPPYFCLSRVPVVQRIEQGFPKGKAGFLRQSADVVSSAQTAVSQARLCMSRELRAGKQKELAL
jgi:hypothetical protein